MAYFSYARVDRTADVMSACWAHIVSTTGGLTDEQMLTSLMQAKKEGLDVVIPTSANTYQALQYLYMGEIESASELKLMSRRA